MLPVIPLDKANHYIGGQAVFCLTTIACYLAPTGASLWASAVLGLVANVFVAVAKEVWDWWSKKGTPDWRDVVAAMLGCVLPCTLLGVAF